MDRIDDCLSVFAVAAGANNERGLEMARKAIEDYARHLEAASLHLAFSDLLESYGAIPVDSRVGVAIRALLEDRIARLAMPLKSTPLDDAEAPSVRASSA